MTSAFDEPSSIVSPLATLGRLLSTNFAPSDGSSLWATVTVFVPRSIWSEKPIGFGSPAHAPPRTPDGWDGTLDGCAKPGEWFYDWRWVGLVLMVPVVGLLVRWLDSVAARAVAMPLTSRRTAMGAVAMAVAIAGLGDLAWVGSFTYVARTGLREAALLAIPVSFAWHVRRERFSSPGP